MNVGDNEIWDEFRWEKFLRHQEKKLDKYLELFYKCSGDPDHKRNIAEAMGWSHILGFESEIGEGEEPPYSSEVDEELEGESWKRIAGYEGYDDHHAALDRLPAFRVAYDFALSVNSFVDSLSPEMKEDSTVVEFLSLALLAPAKIADGFEMGTELDALGGNIANCKRALVTSNQVIKALVQLKTQAIVPQRLYSRLVRGAVEARNAIAAHVVDLREQFRSGLP
ncbi:MAG: hypothetical protein ACE5H0_00570 [Bacteroidota bacterium]